MANVKATARIPPSTDRSVVYARWRHMYPRLIYVSLGAPESTPLPPPKKLHYDRFGRFCTLTVVTNTTQTPRPHCVKTFVGVDGSVSMCSAYDAGYKVSNSIGVHCGCTVGISGSRNNVHGGGAVERRRCLDMGHV